MSYTPDSPIRLVPGESQDISEQAWVDVYRAQGSFTSPLWNGIAAADRDATCRAMYQYVTAKRHRASFWLAIPGREHGWGADRDSVLWRMDTRSATNARTVRMPGLSTTTVHDPVRKSDYVRYQNVFDSLKDGLYRVDDPGYAYAGKASIADVIHTWTESDGDAYTAYVVGMMNRWTNGGVVVPTQQGDDPRFQWQPDVTEFGYPTQGTHGRSGRAIELLILHITAGTDSLGWLVAGNGSSCHYLTDAAGKPRAQLVREADAAWCAGSREYNERGINVEVEMPNVGGWTDAIMREVARTVAPIMARNGIPAVYLGRDNGAGKRGMIGHRDVPDGSGGWGGSSHHDDPGADFDWPTFTRYVAAELAGGQAPTPAPQPGANPPAMPQTVPDPWKSPRRPGTWIPKVFADAIKPDWMRAGYVVSEAFIEGNLIVQYFERARLELDARQNVSWGLVGYEAMVARYPERKAA